MLAGLLIGMFVGGCIGYAFSSGRAQSIQNASMSAAVDLADANVRAMLPLFEVYQEYPPGRERLRHALSLMGADHDDPTFWRDIDQSLERDPTSTPWLDSV
jgi:hypothetical protein